VNVGKFYLTILLAAALFGGLVWVGAAHHFFPMPSFFFHTLLFLVLSTGLIFLFLYKTQGPIFFLQRYLVTITVKVLMYGAYNFIMIFMDRAAASVNVVFFMVVYVIFTALEIAFLFRKISRKQRP
jgi:hypothetical protein